MRELLINKLISSLEYSPASASKTAEDLCGLKYTDLRAGLLDWLQTGTQAVIQDDPYSTVSLMEKYHMTYPAALIFLEWYREDPETAVSVLRMRM